MNAINLARRLLDIDEAEKMPREMFDKMMRAINSGKYTSSILAKEFVPELRKVAPSTKTVVGDEAGDFELQTLIMPWFSGMDVNIGNALASLIGVEIDDRGFWSGDANYAPDAAGVLRFAHRASSSKRAMDFLRSRLEPYRKEASEWDKQDPMFAIAGRVMPPTREDITLAVEHAYGFEGDQAQAKRELILRRTGLHVDQTTPAEVVEYGKELEQLAAKARQILKRIAKL